MIILTHGLVHIVSVRDESSTSLLLGALLSLSKNFSSGDLVLPDHLNSKDVVDLDVMSRDPVVQEGGREHHVISGEPEFGLILIVEVHDVSGTIKSESGENASGGKTVHEHSRVVQGCVLVANKARQNGTHHSEDLVRVNPQVVGDSESLEHSVTGVLTGTNFNSLEHASNKTSSSGESLIDEVLKSGGVTE